MLSLFEKDILYTHFNFPVKERVGPLIHLLHLDVLPPVHFIVEFLLCLGGLYLLSLHKICNKGRTLLFACTIAFALWYLVGANPYFWNFYWFPWVVWALRFGGRSFLGVVFFATFLALWLFAAGAMGPMGCLAVFVASFFISDSVVDERMFSYRVVALRGIILVASIAALWVLPTYIMPDYPGGARLTAITPFDLYETPKLGPYLIPNPMRYSRYVEALDVMGWRLFVSGLLFIGAAGYGLWGQCQRESKWSLVELDSSSFVRRLGVALLFLLLISASMVGELLLPSTWGMYAPYPTAARIVPGLALIGMPWRLFPLLLILLVPMYARWFSSRVLVVLMVSFIGLMAHSGEYTQILHQFEEVSTLNYRVKVMTSPSRAVVEEKGDWLTHAAAKKLREKKNLKQYFVPTHGPDALVASINQNHAIFMIDYNSATRWSTTRPQRQGDQFRIDFAQPLRVIKIVLANVVTPGDFPRGLRIIAHQGNATEKVVFDEPRWLGPVRWTENGYPYYGPQTEVVIDLHDDYEVSGFTFIQTGSDTVYDWSISDLEFFTLN